MAAYLNLLAGQREMPARFERELRTIATALDGLLAGDLSLLGDVLAARFKAVELASREGWSVAESAEPFEVLPDHRLSAATDAEIREAARLASSRRRLERDVRGSQPHVRPGANQGDRRDQGDRREPQQQGGKGGKGKDRGGKGGKRQ